MVAFPLIGWALQCLLGKQLELNLGRRVVGILAVLPVAAAFVCGAIITMGMMKAPAESRTAIETAFSWIQTLSLNIPFELRVDPLSMTMVLIITGIGSLIHLYATGYMAEEPDYTRFFSYFNLFIACMLMLVLGNNLALLFIGWEGVGLCSYLLIGFWYKDLANARAGNKAFIVNRIGDWGLTLGLFIIVAVIVAHSKEIGDVGGRYLSYDVVLSKPVLDVFVANPGWATAAALLLFVGAMGKSAQFPLYFWLPDAMAGPTPVSALIHAATMVTSGVVLLNRMHPYFAMSPTASAVVAMIGAFTALFAALIAFGQTDIKKVLAYSTVSQLGFMFVACGVGAYWVGMFHVTTHAFFKALLFLGSGAVIHAMSHDQDMRHYGNLAKYIKITAATMVIGWLAIAGVPPLAGFWSKEAILGGALGNNVAVINGINFGVIAGWVCLFSALLTAAYMTRMTMLTFFGGKEQWRSIPAEHGDHHHHEHHADHAHHAHHGEDVHGFFYTDEEMAARHQEEPHHHHLDSRHEPHEVPPSMWMALAVLALLSVAGGYLMHNHEAFMHWLYPTGPMLLDKEAVAGEPTGWLGKNLQFMGIGVGLLGIAYGWLVYRNGLPRKEGDYANWNPLRRWAGNQFNYDKTVVDAGVDGGGAIADFTYQVLDVKGVDGIARGLAGLVALAAGLLRKLQNGLVRSYAAMMMFGAVGLIGYIFYVITTTGGAR